MIAIGYFVSIPDRGSSDYLKAVPLPPKTPLFDTCPKHRYRHDNPEILKLLGSTTEEPACIREEGPTYLEGGKIFHNLYYPWTDDFNCTARCAFYDTVWINKYGPECVVGDNCTTFECDIIDVKCWGLDGNLTHIDLHTQIFEHSRDRPAIFGERYRAGKTPKIDPKTRFHPSVHIIVLDSAGRFPALRQLNKTITYLKNEFQAVDFTAMSRIGYASRSNAYGAFFGDLDTTVDRSMYGGLKLNATIDAEICKKGLDERAYIQFEYEDAGYRTMYAEDYFTATWTYNDCAGISKQPATHHLRPFQLLTFLTEDVWGPELLKDAGYKYQDQGLLRAHLRNKTRCGTNHQHAIDYTSKFIRSYSGLPKMSISWLDEAHDSEKEWRHSDKYYHQMLVENKEPLSDSIVIFLGDHGQRFGTVAATEQGIFEGKNPLLLISLPERLRKTKMAKQLAKNKDELLSHHDLYATLVDIIRYQPTSNFTDTRFKKIEGTLGNSLLRSLDPTMPRSCKYLPIPAEYCICDYGAYRVLESNDSMWNKLPTMIEKDADVYLAKNGLAENCDAIRIANVTSITTKTDARNATLYKVDFFTTNQAEFQVSYELQNETLRMNPQEFIRLNRS
ncbi:unnamed protein product, partial [Mesorhabditis spiculigera]